MYSRNLIVLLMFVKMSGFAISIIKTLTITNTF